MASEAAQINPLLERLARRIRATGPISVADYMDEVSAFYYATRDPFGAAGDFITAPEVSQIFGELIGAWCADYWQRLGAPDPVLLVELGPGRGTLIADALRATRNVPGFHRALRLHLVERSPKLRALQQEKLADFAPVFHEKTAIFAPMERDGTETLPHAPMLLIANEFLDALPIAQFVRCKTGWHQRKVGIDPDGKSLVFCLAEDPTLLGGIPDGGLFARATEGDVVESCSAAEKLAENLGVRLRRHGGAALFIDYARAPSPYGDTLQAVRGHRSHSILLEPGSADLTAHVDFAAFVRAAESDGAQAYGSVTQRDFLLRLGLEARKRKLLERATPEQAQTIETGCRRLIDPAEMGTLFKVLALGQRGAPTPAGFAEAQA
jgi:NADH dehydrogenase [ubiquinone] 1 alpha subcomplex assembly factor 7